MNSDLYNKLLEIGQALIEEDTGISSAAAVAITTTALLYAENDFDSLVELNNACGVIAEKKVREFFVEALREAQR